MAERKKDYYKTSEAAKLLGIAVSTVQLWANNGSLRAWTTDGGHRRIEKSSVEEMLGKQLPDDTTSSSAISTIQTPGSKPFLNDNLVYLALSLGESHLKKELIANMKQAHCQVQIFSSTAEIKNACDKERPTVIIMDMAFNDGEYVGLEAITQLKNSIDSCPYCLFISEYDNPEDRLAAVRAGVDRYFYKPLKMDNFINTLTALKINVSENIKPYRVLIVDDNEISLKCYSAVLKNAGMDVECLSDPFDALATLDTFKPDLIVTDVYMPECSGPELIRMIRQDDKWNSIPFILTSGDGGINNQLEAMNLGAEDFLAKPVKNNKLVVAITSVAKRARLNTYVNKHLKNVVRENKYQLVTLDQHALVSVTDIAGQITHANKKFCEVSGYDENELLGQNHRILKSDYHPALFYAELWKTISSGEVWHGIICNQHKNGDEYWVEATIVPFLTDKGKPYKYVSTRTNITALRQSEERLQRSQLYAGIGIWDWNIVKGEVYWSEQTKYLYGYKHELENISFEHFNAILHPDDKKAVNDAVINCMEKGVKYDIEHRVIWPDGSVHWMLERGDVLRNEKGEPLHFQGVVQDVTKRVEAQINQKELEERFTFAVEGAGDGVWDWDIRTNVLKSSPQMFEMLGYKENEFSAHLRSWIKLVHPDDVTNSKKKIFDYIQGRILSYSLEQRLRCKDGSYKWILSRGKVVERDQENNPLRMTGIHTDISKIKETEYKLILAREEAEIASRAKSKFLDSMSHELRTPMNAIIGFSQLLKMEVMSPLNAVQQEHVNEILTAGTYLMTLINEVLDLSSIEAGRIDMTIENLFLGEVVAESMNLIMPLAQRRNIEVSLTRDNSKISYNDLNQKKIVVKADQSRLKQVLINLLSNAVKYNRENGKVTLNCNVLDNNQLRISVCDTGPGLTEKQQSQLFTSFNRLGAEQTAIEGSGIGLVITKNIIDLMGGSIGAECTPDIGCNFWIELPLGLDSVADVTQEEKEELPSFLNIKTTRTLLYIEDNPSNLKLVSSLFMQLQNIQLLEADNPSLGIELAKKHKPDLILLDINLPGMTGFEVLQNFRNMEITNKIPIIAVSANVMAEEIRKALEAGFDDYITKPIDVTALLLTVDKQLTGNKNI